MKLKVKKKPQSKKSDDDKPPKKKIVKKLVIKKKVKNNNVKNNNVKNNNVKNNNVEPVNNKKKKKIKLKMKDLKSNSTKFMAYPDIIDPGFYEKIYLKKEFRDHVIPKQTKTIEEMCAPCEFKLAPQQEFLRNFISIDTPYNGLLVFHGTGVGKTCAAVSIAEGFKEVMQRLHLGDESKIIVILPQQISDNFKKDIYDYDKESRKKYPDDIVQCTGNTYMLDYDTYKSYTLAQKLREINKRINNNYTFMGYDKFANDVMRRTNWDGKPKNLTDEIIKRIKILFSNRLMIIDEVHNVKSSSDEEYKKVPPILDAVVRHADNMRIVLMSATPMYDSASEFVYVLNLLLANDKRKPVRTSEIFDKNNNFVEGGEALLRKLSRGYISYLRGENPITFPQKIFPSFSTIPTIKYDIKGNEIPEEERIHYTKITMCPMSEFQYTRYKSLINVVDSPKSAKKKSKTSNNSNNNNSDNNNSDNNESNKNSPNKNSPNKNSPNPNNTIAKEEAAIHHMQPLIHAANIIYVNKKEEIIRMSQSTAYPKSDNGEGAFIRSDITDPRTKKKYMEFKYQSHLIFDKGTKAEKPFLDADHIHKYSAKYAEALDIIKRSTGIIYVYSQFIWAGVLPFALMLEQNGYRRYLSEGEKPLLEYPRNRAGGGGTRDEVCYACGKSRNYEEHTEGHSRYHRFKMARYIILTASTDLNKIESEQAVSIMNQKNNMYGEEVKIIVGTRKISEGLDFKRLRQVHVLEPWYNMARIDQLVGRAVRNCSHVDLPPNMRNVEVLFYAVAPPVKTAKKEQETETVDTRYYRRAENKDVKIKAVEDVLRSVAIDCVFNKNANIFEKRKEIDMITASGEKRRIAIGDEPNTRDCHYKKSCEYKCEWEPLPGKIYPVNKDTYNLRFAKSNIEQAKKYIKELFRKDVIFDLPRIVKYICGKADKSIEKIFIYKALNNFVTDCNDVVYDKYGRKGYLIYRGKYYIFQPSELNYKKIGVYYRRTPLTEKPDEFSIENIGNNNNNNNNIVKTESANANVASEDIIEKTIKSIIAMEKTVFNKANNSSKSRSIIADMIIDRYSAKQKTLLLVNVMVDYFNKKMDDYRIAIFTHFGENVLFKNRDLHYNDPKHKSDNEVFGYIIQDNLYCWNKKKFEECDAKTKEAVLLNRKIRLEREKKRNSAIQFSKVMGYLDQMRSGKLEFKIKDYTTETGAVTLAGKRSKRAEVRGKVCGTYKKYEQEDLMKRLGMKYNADIRIKDVCAKIEYMLRKKNEDRDDGKIWFERTRCL